jgi:hypothetical protein
MLVKSFSKLKKFKVLVGTPHNQIKNYCFDDFLANVTNLTYKNYNVLIADNSKERKNFKNIKKVGVQSVYVRPRQNVNQQYIAYSHEELREAALRGGYDFLLHLESDVFPPKDIIERLLVHQLPVVSAPYFIDEGHKSHLMIQEIEDRGDLVRETRNIDGGKDILFMDGTVKEVYSAGLGACLIHKDILKQFKFRYEKGAPVHPDSFFAADLNMLGIKQYIDTSFLCQHRNSSWANVLDTVPKNLDGHIK